jgi:hypothetical protein
VGSTGAVAGAVTAPASESQTGASWSALIPIGKSLQLAAVSCPTSRFCAVANDSDANYDAGIMYTFNGTRWSKPTVLDKYAGSPDSVSCPTTRFCAVIDNAGSVYTFDGTRWSTPTVIDPVPPANQTAVSCASGGFCVAIDDSGGDEIFNGKRWTSKPNFDPTGGGSSAESCSSNQEGTCSAPAAISCPSSNFCAAVDGTGSVFTFNGGGWSAATVVDTQNPIVSLSCASSSFCVAVDGLGKAAVFDGTSWTAPSAVSTSALASVSCPSSGFCVAVDRDGNAAMFDGTSWTTPTAVSTWALASVSCPSSEFCVAVNDRSSVLTFGTATAFPQSLIRFRASSARVSSTGTVVIHVSCPRSIRNCSDTVSLKSTGIRGTLASAEIDLTQGKSGNLKLKLSKAGLAHVEQAKGHKLKVTATTQAGQSVTKTALTLGSPMTRG